MQVILHIEPDLFEVGTATLVKLNPARHASFLIIECMEHGWLVVGPQDFGAFLFH